MDAYDIDSHPDSPFNSSADDIHAGDMETSLMLYLKPELVDMPKAVDFIPDKPRPYLNYGSIFTLSPSGVWGNAAQATARKGRWMFENAVADVSKKIEKLFMGINGV
jgi:creatinine amidohydrolase